MATSTWKVFLVAPDTPIRDLSKSEKANRGDRVFNTTITGAAFASLAVLAGITFFLGAKAVPVVQDQGIGFLATTFWDTTGVPLRRTSFFGTSKLLWKNN